jgi:hypothetical protein
MGKTATVSAVGRYPPGAYPRPNIGKRYATRGEFQSEAFREITYTRQYGIWRPDGKDSGRLA